MMVGEPRPDRIEHLRRTQARAPARGWDDVRRHRLVLGAAGHVDDAVAVRDSLHRIGDRLDAARAIALDAVRGRADGDASLERDLSRDIRELDRLAAAAEDYF